MEFKPKALDQDFTQWCSNSPSEPLPRCQWEGQEDLHSSLTERSTWRPWPNKRALKQMGLETVTQPSFFFFFSHPTLFDLIFLFRLSVYVSSGRVSSDELWNLKLRSL